jgi:hypothetical protein
MSDLYLAMSVMAAVSVGIFFLARWAFRPVSRSLCLLALLAAIAGLVFYLKYGQDRLEFARWLPVSALVIYANFTPLIAALAAGIIWHAVRPPPREENFDEPGSRHIVRRTVLILALWGISAYQAWHILWAEPPPLGHRRTGVVWRQTTQASCSPAAAATLLATHRIASSEAEMAQLCLTTRKGTRTLGVYRGLVLKTSETHRVETYTGDARGLRAFASTPVLINVGLDPEDVAVDPRFITDWGWQPGARHTVVVLAWLPNDQLLVADPAVGVERWTPRALEVLWQREAFKLVPRQSPR